MFYLKTSIHLEKEELFILIDELNRAGIEVSDGLCGLDGSGAHFVFNTLR